MGSKAYKGMAAFAVLRLGRLSERPEVVTPAFQFLLVAGGDFYQTPGEDRSDSNRNGCHQATVETPLA